MRALALAVALAEALASGCDRGAPRAAMPASSGAPAANPSAAEPAPRTASVSCSLDPSYPALWQLPEASAAVEVELRPGDRAILALADSDNHGQGMLWHLPRGPLEPVRLELDRNASDDVEGAAWLAGHLYTLTSSGAVRRYTPSVRGAGGAPGVFTRDRTAYAIGPRPYMCDTLYDGNCGKNYEGLCLRAASAGAACAGYAASKAEGSLYCVVLRGDALAIDVARPPIKLDLPRHALSDCAFGSAAGPAETTLIVTTNVYGGSHTYVVDEATGGLARVDVSGLLSNEAVAIDHDGALYQFMDANTTISPAYRATCEGWGVR